MSLTITANTATLTAKEAGALASLLLTLHPDAVSEAIEGLGVDAPTGVWSKEAVSPTLADAQALERGTPEQPPVATIAPKWPEGEQVVEPLADPVTPEPAAALTPEQAFGVTLPDAPVLVEGDAPPTVDALGLPWDARIHATGKDGGGIMTDKSVWRKKRGLNQLIEHKVIAELRAIYPAPETPQERTAREAVAAGLVAPPEAGAPLPPVAPPAPVAEAAAVSEGAPAPLPPVAAAVPPPPLSVPTPAASTGPAPSRSPADQFTDLMRLITSSFDATGQAAMTAEINAALGLTAISALLAPANHGRIAEAHALVVAKLEAGQ